MSQKQINTQMGLSRNTSVDWLSFSREVYENAIAPVDPTNVVQIRGEGKTVETDESKFARRKYHRGHNTKLGWVFGGVGRGKAENCFLVEVRNRKAETLVVLIERDTQWQVPQ